MLLMQTQKFLKYPENKTESGREQQDNDVRHFRVWYHKYEKIFYVCLSFTADIPKLWM